MVIEPFSLYQLLCHDIAGSKEHLRHLVSVNGCETSVKVQLVLTAVVMLCVRRGRRASFNWYLRGGEHVSVDK